MRIVALLTAIAAALPLAGCLEENVADKREREQTARLTEQASTQVGMPAIVRFSEKRNLKMLYELRDNPKLATVAYIVDMQGKLHKICDALGYGFPYATQFTNPQRDTWYGSGGPGSGTSVHFQMPQPEPNGLFMPNAADGTWIMCLNPETKDMQPVYIEPRVIVSPFPLKVD
jgi:hypothetical protein